MTPGINVTHFIRLIRDIGSDELHMRKLKTNFRSMVVIYCLKLINGLSYLNE